MAPVADVIISGFFYIAPEIMKKSQLLYLRFLSSTVPPRITTEPEREFEVSVGQNLTLTCNASGDPLPEVIWNKEGQALRLFNVTGPVLHLVNVTREDVGSYKCTTKNKVGEDSRPAVVNIVCK